MRRILVPVLGALFGTSLLVGLKSHGLLSPGGAEAGAVAGAPRDPAAATFTGTAVAVRTAQSPSSLPSACRECRDYTMAVTITVSRGRITSATVAYEPSPGVSLSGANRASGALNQKVLVAQAWNLGRVSGATYSANAYELSLKDAMIKAGLPT